VLAKVDSVALRFAGAEMGFDLVQTAVEAAVPAGCGFDFDGDVAVCGFGEDVYLGAVVVAPEVEWVSEAGIG